MRSMNTVRLANKGIINVRTGEAFPKSENEMHNFSHGSVFE
jgi:hypothetical protein